MRLLAMGAVAVGLFGLALSDDCAAQDWWPGPTPQDIRDANMKKRRVKFPNEQDLKKMEKAAPDKAPARPAKPRRVLSWGRLWTHAGNAFAEEAVKMLGKKTGAFEVVASDDPRLLLPESLKKFDAIFLNNLHDQQPFLPLDWRKLRRDPQHPAKRLDKAIKQSILEFIMEDGKGVAGVHGAIAALKDWKEFGEMMGGFHVGHYGGRHVIKADDPGHPINACFEGKPFKIGDECYIPGPFSRREVRVLLSLDLTQMKAPAEKNEWLKKVMEGREDDYPISWIRKYGRGRSFYCGLGHSPNTYLDPLFLRHLLAGIQFVIGDLPGETAPSVK